MELVYPAREQSQSETAEQWERQAARARLRTPAEQETARRRERLHYHCEDVRKVERAYRRSLAEGRDVLLDILNAYFVEGSEAMKQDLEELRVSDAAWADSSEFDDLPQQ